MNFEEHKKLLLKNPEFARLWKESEFEYQIMRMLIKARIERGYTQKALARKLKTQQSAISRIEQGMSLPSLSFLKKVAKALNAKLTVTLTDIKR